MSLVLTWDSATGSRAADGGDLVLYTVSSIDIDAVLSVDYSWSGVQSHRPVESAAPTSDHYRRNLETVSIVCAHSDTPGNKAPYVTVQTRVAAGGDKAMMGIISVDEGVGKARYHSITDIMDVLRGIILRGHQLTIAGTGLKKTLDGYRLLQVSIPTAAGQDGVIEFSLQFEELRKVYLEALDDPLPRIERARPRRSRGAAPTSTPIATAAETGTDRQGARSMLQSALRSLSGGE